MKPHLRKGLVIGLIAGTVVAVFWVEFVAPQDAAGPGGPYERMDARFPGMGLAWYQWLFERAAVMALGGGLLGVFIAWFRKKFNLRGQ